MTAVTFHLEGARIVSVDIRGHSGYAEEGADLICNTVVAAIQLVECTVNDVLGLAAAVKVEPEEPHISLHLPGGLSGEDEHTCQNLLTGMMVYLTGLRQQFPDYITVTEV
ncbi:MAG: ribosomal-processing cysteine protease Prp [Clostridiales bacterium]|nr:ribosomal-processing cysteine protease Prp [Clostridiales bacterium]